MGTIDNRRFACIQLIPVALVEQVLYGGFIHLRPKILLPRYWVSFVDNRVPEYSYERMMAPALASLDPSDTVAVLVQDWHWEDRNQTSAILSHGQTALTSEWCLLSKAIPDTEITALGSIAQTCDCYKCGTKLNHKKTNDLLMATVQCEACGIHNRLHVDGEWLR